MTILGWDRHGVTPRPAKPRPRQSWNSNWMAILLRFLGGTEGFGAAGKSGPKQVHTLFVETRGQCSGWQARGHQANTAGEISTLDGKFLSEIRPHRGPIVSGRGMIQETIEQSLLLGRVEQRRSTEGTQRQRQIFTRPDGYLNPPRSSCSTRERNRRVQRRGAGGRLWQAG